MKSFVSTVVGGAIGLVALYVVGRVAYQAGHDIAEAEHRYEAAQRKDHAKEQKSEEPQEETASDEDEAVEMPVPSKRQSKLGMLFGLRKAFGKKGTSVIGDLVQNPENHVIEACVKGREIHVNVKPRTA